MVAFTFHDLQCFDAVIRHGGFQAAANMLHRSHPSIFAAVAKLEQQLGILLLDRSGYRVQLTVEGRSFHQRVQPLLREVENLHNHAAQLAMGEESDLHVVVGDICPRPQILSLLSQFFSSCPGTRLHLYCESVTGPVERLLDNKADLILHGIDKNDHRLEWIHLFSVPFIPVVAKDFLSFPISRNIRPAQLRDYTQCVMRDSAHNPPASSHFLIEGAHQYTVADQLIKKEIILQGLAWGHMPRFLVDRELAKGQLLSIAGKHLPGSIETLVAARRRDRPHGPVAARLWNFIQQQLPQLRRVMKKTQ